MKLPSTHQAQQLNIVAGYLLDHPQYYVDTAVMNNGYIYNLPKVSFAQAQILVQYIDEYTTRWGVFDKKIVDANACVYLANQQTRAFVSSGGFTATLGSPKLCQTVALSNFRGVKPSRFLARYYK